MNGKNQNEWDTILADSTFQKQSYNTKRKVAENFFNRNILSKQELQRESQEIRGNVFNDFLKTIGEPLKPLTGEGLVPITPEVEKGLLPAITPTTRKGLLPPIITKEVIPPTIAEPSSLKVGDITGGELGKKGEFIQRGMKLAGRALTVNTLKFIGNINQELRKLPFPIGRSVENLNSLYKRIPVVGERMKREDKNIYQVLANMSDEMWEKWQPEKPTGIYAKRPEKWTGYLDPNRIGMTIGEQGPLMVAFVLTTIANPIAGTALMTGVEGGDAVERIEKYEKETGKKVNKYLKTAIPAVVGLTNAVLERVGIERILKVSRVPGLKAKLVNALLSVVTEGSTEGLQELDQLFAESIYRGELAEDWKEQVIDSVYGGVILGGAGAGVSGTIGAGIETMEKGKIIEPEIEREVPVKKEEIKVQERLFGKPPVMRDIVIPEQGKVKVPVTEGIKVPVEKKDVPEIIYKRAVEKGKKRFFGFKWKKKYKSSKAGIATDIFVPISTRLEAINPSVKSALREHTFKLETQKSKDTRDALSFMESTKKMKESDKIIFDLAQKNSDWNKINEIIKKYGAEKELIQLRNMFDDIHKRAKEVGYEVEYLENYFPRTIRDKQGFLNYLYETDDWGKISESIKIREEKLGRSLSVEEKAYIADNVIRGYGPRKLAVGKPGYLKERKINVIDDVLNEFYYDSNASILKYIERVNDAIEVRRFFGKTKPKPIKLETLRIIGRSIYLGKKEKITTAKKIGDKYEIEGTLFSNMQEVKEYIRKRRPELEKAKLEEANLSRELNIEEIDKSIGDYAARLVEEGKITPPQENELITILRSRFGYRHSRGSVAAMKNIAYMTSLNNVYNAITQFGDLAWSYYTVGPIMTTKHAIKSVFGKSDIKKSDIGITRIAQEFSSINKLGKALEGTFKWIGLEKIDRIGKEALMSATIDKIRIQVRKDKINPYFREKLEKVFGNKTDEVIEEIKSGELTENVKLFAFNTLCDFQPITLDEMPKFYLDSPNGRIFYMLKTFTIKQFDIARRESLWQIKNGKTVKDKALGIERGLRLAAVFILCNATADEIKNFILGRDETFSDKAWDNVLRLIGLSRFVAFNTERYGLTDTLYKLASMPLNILELPYKDISRSIKAYKKRGRLEDIKIKDLETWKIVPFFGKQYHFWFGRGKELEEKYSKAERKKEDKKTIGRLLKERK